MKLVVCISGRGSTLRNLWVYADRGALSGEIIGVVSSRKRGAINDSIFAECERRGVPVNVLGVATDMTLGIWQPDFVLLAGYLVLWHVSERYCGRVLNIHPALLPKYGGKGFYGRRVHEAVLAAGDTESGCTVHFADNEYDHGSIILQRRVPIFPDDTPDVLQARVFAQECEAYPEVLGRLAANYVR